jgi:hypothetical protein
LAFSEAICGFWEPLLKVVSEGTVGTLHHLLIVELTLAGETLSGGGGDIIGIHFGGGTTAQADQ